MNLAANAPAVAFGPEDLACPICVETIEDAFATPCGHTFCYKCISTHLKNRSNCPSCGAHLTQDRIHPNFLLSKLIKHVANSQLNLKTALLQHVQEDLAVAAGKIGLQELDTAIQLLQERRQHVLTHESSNKLQLLLLFLQHAKAKQQGKLSELEQQLTVLQQDLSRALQAQQQQQHHLQPQHQQQPRLELTGSNQVQQLEAAAKPSAIPNGFVVAAAGKSGVSDVSATGVHLQHQQLQQQPVTGANDAHSFGGTASAFRWLPAPIAQQPSVPQQHWQQQQAQQQLNNGSMQELGRAQGFKPFVAQQQLLQSQPQSQPHQQHQPQQENKQLGGFKPYRSFSAAATGLSTATAPLQVQPLQQMQQQQQLAFQQSGLQQHQQQLQQQHQQFAQQQQQQQGQPGYLPGDTNRVQGFTAFEPTPNAYGLNPSSPGLNPDKKRKILQQFDELQHAYMNSRIRKCLMGAGAGGVQQAKPESMAPIGQAGANGITSPGFMPVLGSGAVLQAVNGAVQQEDEGASSSLLHPTVTVNAVNAAPAPSPAAAVGTPAGLAVSGSGAVQPASIALKHEPGFGGVQPIAAAEIQPSNAAGAAGAANAAASSAAATPATQGGTAAEDNGEVIAGADGDQAAELDAFSDVLAGLTYYNSLAPVAHIPPSSSNSNGAAAAAARPGGGASILSSIEFDCAGQLFAAAGVQQRICVYDYQAVMAAQNSSNETPTSFSTAADSAALQPLLDLPTRYKISCVSFSAAVQQYMLSSDYEGLVHLWDLHGGKIVRQWEAHDKRIWAVDSCPLDPDVFATGSDDGTVRVWGLREPPMARLTLPVWANVCSIEFSPAVAHMLAVGNAGHQVHLFDLRSPRGPLAILKGHKKAASYVRWAGADQLVTASTDSTLRLWTATGGKGSCDGQAAAGYAAAAVTSGSCETLKDAGEGGGVPDGGRGGAGSSTAAAAAAGRDSDWEDGGWRCSQVFSGHSNTKHFVGLSTQSPYLACGSESNEVYVYHQGLPKPSMQCLLAPLEAGSGVATAAGVAAATAGGSNSGGGAGKSPFVSALCWKRDSNVLLAANSKGSVWVLSLVTSVQE